MVNEIIRYRIEPDRAGEFLRACNKAKKDLGETGHCVRYDLARCANTPDDYLMLIGWDVSDRRLQALRLSRDLERFRDSIEPFSPDVLATGCYERVLLSGVETAE